MEPVPHVVNVRRGESEPPKNRLKTHCYRGHEFKPENTKIDLHGWRTCRACKREAVTKWRHTPHGREIQREATRRHKAKNGDSVRTAARLAHAKKREALTGRPVYPRKLFCRNGHPRTPENTYTYPGGTVVCLPCRQARGLLLAAS